LHGKTRKGDAYGKHQGCNNVKNLHRANCSRKSLTNQGAVSFCFLLVCAYLKHFVTIASPRALMTFWLLSRLIHAYMTRLTKGMLATPNPAQFRDQAVRFRARTGEHTFENTTWGSSIGR
jgi:hypothetical protein